MATRTAGVSPASFQGFASAGTAAAPARLRVSAGRIVARHARPADVPAIAALIAHYAERGWLLPRTAESVRAGLANFLVMTRGGELTACVALEHYGGGLAEVRSLAVAESERGHGLGARLLRHAMREARRRHVARVFAVTHAPEFFERAGFRRVERASLTEKIARDCRTCAKHPACALVALVFDVTELNSLLRVL